jgi:hypothetical protein
MPSTVPVRQAKDLFQVVELVVRDRLEVSDWSFVARCPVLSRCRT